MKFVSALLKEHLKRYPDMELADIYKLLHQAALGSAHAAPSLDTARAVLWQEAAQMGDGPAEPLLDPISPDGRLARVHLRSYVAAGHDLGVLANAFVQTAQQWSPARDKLERFCGCLGDFAATGEIPFDAATVRAYFAQVAQAGYPSVHHSPVYRTAYRPAYRVVNSELLTLSAD